MPAICRHRARRRPEGGRGLRPGSRRDARRGRRPGRAATRPHSASIRRRTSARSATGARSSRGPSDRRRGRARVPRVRLAAPADRRGHLGSTAGSTSSRRPSSGSGCVTSPTTTLAASTIADGLRPRSRGELRFRTADPTRAAARLPPVRRPDVRTGTRSGRGCASNGVGDADPLPGARPPAAGLPDRNRRSGRPRRHGARLAARSSACRCIPQLTDGAGRSGASRSRQRGGRADA